MLPQCSNWLAKWLEMPRIGSHWILTLHLVGSPCLISATGYSPVDCLYALCPSETRVESHRALLQCLAHYNSIKLINFPKVVNFSFHQKNCRFVRHWNIHGQRVKTKHKWTSKLIILLVRWASTIWQIETLLRVSKQINTSEYSVQVSQMIVYWIPWRLDKAVRGQWSVMIVKGKPQILLLINAAYLPRPLVGIFVMFSKAERSQLGLYLLWS